MAVGSVLSLTGGGVCMDGPVSDASITIQASTGLTCEKRERRCTADGSVRMRYGPYTLFCDRLTAYFKEDQRSPEQNPSSQRDGGLQDGAMRLDRADAVGHVKVVSDDGRSHVTGTYATYDVDQETVVMTGQGLSLVRDDLTVTARESLTFRHREQKGIARGNAVAVQGGKRLDADVLTAYFQEPYQEKTGPKGNNGPHSAPIDSGQNLRQIDADGHVVVRIDGKMGTAQRGVYDGTRESAMLFGDVRLTDQNGQIEAPYGEINLKTGKSRVLSALPPSLAHLAGDVAPQPKQIHLLLRGTRK